MIPVGRYLPGVIPAGGKIIIRALLQHRSGHLLPVAMAIGLYLGWRPLMRTDGPIWRG